MRRHSGEWNWSSERRQGERQNRLRWLGPCWIWKEKLWPSAKLLNWSDGTLEYELVQTGAGVYDLHLVSQRLDNEKLGEDATRILKMLYGQEAKVLIIYKAAIAPERSGKYLISRALFPIELEKYLA